MSLKKKPFHHGDLRRALLEASLAILEREGVAALSLRRVAEEAGVTHAAPYHHFPEKTALLAAIAAEGFSLLDAKMREEVERAPDDPVARLQAAGRGYLRFALEHRGHFAVMFRPELADPVTYPSVDEAGQPSHALLSELCAKCQAAGYAANLDPQGYVLLAWSAVHGAASLWLDGPLARTTECGGGDSSVLDSVVEALGALTRLGMRRPCD